VGSLSISSVFSDCIITTVTIVQRRDNSQRTGWLAGWHDCGCLAPGADCRSFDLYTAGAAAEATLMLMLLLRLLLQQALRACRKRAVTTR